MVWDLLPGEHRAAWSPDPAAMTARILLVGDDDALGAQVRDILRGDGTLHATALVADRVGTGAHLGRADRVVVVRDVGADGLVGREVGHRRAHVRGDGGVVEDLVGDARILLNCVLSGPIKIVLFFVRLNTCHVS